MKIRSDQRSDQQGPRTCRECGLASAAEAEEECDITCSTHVAATVQGQLTLQGVREGHVQADRKLCHATEHASKLSLKTFPFPYLLVQYGHTTLIVRAKYIQRKRQTYSNTVWLPMPGPHPTP